jgi:hypothetical protein
MTQTSQAYPPDQSAASIDAILVAVELIFGDGGHAARPSPGDEREITEIVAEIARASRVEPSRPSRATSPRSTAQ